jgi:hypothetical protein
VRFGIRKSPASCVALKKWKRHCNETWGRFF